MLYCLHRRYRPLRGALGPALAALLLTACGGDTAAPAGLAPDAGSAELEAHSGEFTERVLEVAPGVHVAIGYALANVILIEGDDGVIIVDTTESLATARRVKAEFDRITDKPVQAIIYTHNHTDHIFGAAAFAPDGNVPIYAHRSTFSHIQRIINVLRPVIEARSYRMFGSFLAQGGERIVNDGIGPALAHTPGDDSDVYGLLPPTRSFDDRLDVTIAGRRVVLQHVPGETDDAILVWLPEQKVLLPGDNVYKAFPNLYTIRGTRYRDVQQWAHSLRRMAELGAEHLIPSHTGPVSGGAQINTLLTQYADAIQYVHDQTVRGMNAGRSADELARSLQLPPELAQHPWLQPFYGTVPWSVRAIYQGYLGWFDGNSTTLFPTAAPERARRLVSLAGGSDSLLAEAKRQLPDDPQWAAELADLLIAGGAEGAVSARAVKARALRKLAATTPNPNARNWYLTDALELEGAITVQASELGPERVAFASNFPVLGVLQSMAVSLDPARAAGINRSLVLNFPDQASRYRLHVRNQVAVISELAADSTLTEGEVELTVSAADWLQLVTGQRNFVAAFADDTLSMGAGLADVADVVSFLRLFRAED